MPTQPVESFIFNPSTIPGSVSCYGYMEHICEDCHELSFSECGSIPIFALLTPNSVYTAHLTDKFGNHYQASFTSSASGGFSASNLDLPAGFFNQWSGDIELKVTALPNSTDYVDLNISGTNKKCIIISITE